MKIIVASEELSIKLIFQLHSAWEETGMGEMNSCLLTYVIWIYCRLV